MADQNGRAVQPATQAAPAEGLDLLKQNYAPKASDAEFELFAHVAQTLGLSPQAQQIYAVSRFNKNANRYEMTVQLSVHGLRLIAERTGMYGGTDSPLWCGRDGQWVDVWLSEEPPSAAKVCVWRKDAQRPTVGLALWREFAQTDRYGKLTGLWGQMPANQLAVAAERQALRKAFQMDILATESVLGDAVITVDEMAPATLPEPPKQLPSPQPEPSPAGDHAAPSLPSIAEVATPRAPMSALAGGAIEEKPDITAFYELCQGQLNLDRAAIKQLLDVDVADDTAALTKALDDRYMPHTRKGLANLAEVVSTLVTARDAQPVPDDDPMVEPVEAYIV